MHNPNFLGIFFYFLLFFFHFYKIFTNFDSFFYMIKNFYNEELIRSLIKGDEQAFSFLINTFHKKLFVYALSLTNDTSMTQDIVQNVFLRTWEHRKNLNPDFSIKSFLYKAVYNEFINQYHRNKCISNLEKIYVEALNNTVVESNDALLEKKIALVTQEIGKLPAKCKETFLLSKKEGLTNMEIAEYLNVSIKCVEAQITKAYSILRDKVTSRLCEILFLIFKRPISGKN